jgi:hypothetical protein
VPRPSSPPGAKASTRCPSLAPTQERTPQPRPEPASPTMHRTNQHHPATKAGRRLGPHTITLILLSTLKTLLNTAARHRRGPHLAMERTGSDKRSPRPRHGPPARPRHRTRQSRPATRAPEPSCAPRSAPEPDSHCHKDQTQRYATANPAQRQWPATAHRTRTQPRQNPTLVEADGIEPTTPCLQSRCSPS